MDGPTKGFLISGLIKLITKLVKSFSNQASLLFLFVFDFFPLIHEIYIYRADFIDKDSLLSYPFVRSFRFDVRGVFTFFT